MKVVKNRYFFTLIAFVLISISSLKAQVKTNKMTTYTDKGVAAPAAYFTGTVFVNMNVTP